MSWVQIALYLVLIVLVIAGAWLLVELALTIKSARSVVESLNDKVDGLTNQVVETMEEIKPILANVDTTLTNLQPTVQELQPLLSKVGTTVDAVSLDLLRVDEILADVSDITSTGAHASNAAGNVVANASHAANQVINKVRGKLVGKEKSKAQQVERVLAEAELPEQEYFTLEPRLVKGDEGYFTYPSER